MKIFIGFGYNEYDEWIKNIVLPFVELYGATVVTGEDMAGNIIVEEVKKRISNCDAVLGFLTRREKLDEARYSTHQWVKDELVTAHSLGKPIVEIREEGVATDDGILGGRQRIAFQPAAREKLMLELGKIMFQWKRQFDSKKFQLFPQADIINDVKKYIKSEFLQCQYKFMEGNKESESYNGQLFAIGQSLCVVLHNIPSDDAFVQVAIKGPGFFWSSSYEPVEYLSINLERTDG